MPLLTDSQTYLLNGYANLEHQIYIYSYSYTHAYVALCDGIPTE